MARVLVVSRNPAMSMSLAGGEHEVDTCRPALLDRWTEGTEQADAYILDLGEPDDAIAAVEHLRATGRRRPGPSGGGQHRHLGETEGDSATRVARYFPSR